MVKKVSKIEDTIIQPKNDKKTRVLYARVSSLDQKTDRQIVDAKSYDLVIEDKCSGSIPFFERDGGKNKDFGGKGLQYGVGGKIFGSLGKGFIRCVEHHIIFQ